jgi:hypothetical protein
VTFFTLDVLGVELETFLRLKDKKAMTKHFELQVGKLFY